MANKRSSTAPNDSPKPTAKAGARDKQKQAVDDQEALAIIKDISPVVWQHINLFGKFEFSPSTSNVDIDALVARYAEQAY
jgi:hypothetical protein